MLENPTLFSSLYINIKYILGFTTSLIPLGVTWGLFLSGLLVLKKRIDLNL